MTITRRGVIQLLAAVAGVAALDPQRVAILSADELPVEIADRTSSPQTTPLDSYLRSHGIKVIVLARESGYSRQLLLRLRTGKVQPTLSCMIHIVAALQRITGDRVRAREVFGVTL